MRSRGLKILGVNVLVFVALLAVFEGAAQLTSWLRPAYDVLALQPDSVLGWTEVPDLEWKWAGPRWYASDYSVIVHANSLGFRDADRDTAKAAGVRRVALLGDSFIEAVQVPFEHTGGQLLEQRLNADQVDGARWEVLNFGISNYGLGQCLLAWEHAAERYHPDYVAVFVAHFHMERTMRKYEFGTFPGTQTRALWVRPTFDLDDGELVRERARDYHEFVRVQERVMREQFGGRRWRRRTQLVTLYYGREIARRLRWALRSHDTVEHATPSDATRVLEVGLRVLSELGRQVEDAGARLVVLDASQYFGDDVSVTRALENFCAQNGYGYIPLYRSLLDANESGRSTRWRHDYHFNATGNAILADDLYGWLVDESH